MQYRTFILASFKDLQWIGKWARQAEKLRGKSNSIQIITTLEEILKVIHGEATLIVRNFLL